jgi:hypothetical protein
LGLHNETLSHKQKSYTRRLFQDAFLEKSDSVGQPFYA